MNRLFFYSCFFSIFIMLSTTYSQIITDFRVNDVDSSVFQTEPSISADGSGNFMITWVDLRNEDWDIYAQRYSSDGTALGGNFKVNDGDSIQTTPSISIDGSGNYLIAWLDTRHDKNDVFAQRYSSNGSLLGENFKVTDNEGSVYCHRSLHSCFRISSGGGENFVITWTDDRNDYGDIYAQRYSSNSTALGGNFKVNDDEGDTIQGVPSISTDSSDNFVITWGDGRNDDDDIFAQRYSSDGIPIGENFQVNDDEGGVWQGVPDVSTDSSGNFVITWIDDRNDYEDIYAQRYSSDGTALGGNFKVNDDEGSEWQGSPSISTESSGNFVITWWNGEGDMFAQRYSNDGNPIGDNFLVTSIGFYPDAEIINGRIYNTWIDEFYNKTGSNIWANVLDFNNPVGINDDNISKIPSAYNLHQNYPNPFNPSTTLEFTLPKSESVELKVYNLLGKEVTTLVSNKLNQGNHTYTFDGKNLASGIYYYQLVAGDYREVKKMILIR